MSEVILVTRSSIKEMSRHSIYWLGDGLLKGAQKQ